MSVFSDKKYESLDWISQATEPIESELNMILSSMPDVIDLSDEDIFSYIQSNYNMTIRATSFINKYVDKAVIDNFSYAERKAIKDCFTFVVVGQPKLDFKAKKILNGSFQIKKIKYIIEENVLKEFMGASGVSRLYYASPRNVTLCNEVLEILGGKALEALQTKSLKTKKRAIYSRLEEIFEKDEWRIRDVALSNKVGHWIADYISGGPISNFANLCKLKVMTHSGQAIYSIEEVI
jgi:hypothetical protein